MRNGHNIQEDEERTSRVLTVELEFSKEWSLQNSLPILKHLVSEYKDFLRVTEPGNAMPKGEKAMREHDENELPFIEAIPAPGHPFVSEIESRDKKPRRYDEEVTLQE